MSGGLVGFWACIILVVGAFVVAPAGAFGPSLGYTRTAPYHGHSYSGGLASLTCGSTHNSSTPGWFFMKRGVVKYDTSASTYPCGGSSRSSLDLHDYVGVESPLLTLGYAVSNQTAHWNLSYSINITIHNAKNCQPSASITIGVVATFNLNGASPVGRISAVHRSISNGSLSISGSRVPVSVYGNAKLPAGSTVHVYNVVEVEITLSSGNVPGCSVDADVSLSHALSNTHLLSWSIR